MSFVSKSFKKQLRNRTHVAKLISCLVADKRAVSDNQRTATSNVNGATLKQFDFPPHQLEDSSRNVFSQK